jgi:flagellar biosynthetic protein FliQ
MTLDDVVVVGRDALYMIIKVAMPPLLVSMVVGLIISIFQTATSIQEQTLTFVPKLLAIFITLLIAGYWMLKTLAEYMIELWSNFALYIR